MSTKEKGPLNRYVDFLNYCGGQTIRRRSEENVKKFARNLQGFSDPMRDSETKPRTFHCLRRTEQNRTKQSNQKSKCEKIEAPIVEWRSSRRKNYEKFEIRIGIKQFLIFLATSNVSEKTKRVSRSERKAKTRKLSVLLIPKQWW